MSCCGGSRTPCRIEFEVLLVQGGLGEDRPQRGLVLDPLDCRPDLVSHRTETCGHQDTEPLAELHLKVLLVSHRNKPPRIWLSWPSILAPRFWMLPVASTT